MVKEMRFLRYTIVPLFAAGLLAITSEVYSVRVDIMARNERSAQSKKPIEYYYVCPMHEDVTSKKPGKCPKCKMTLVKKKIKEPVAKPPDQ
jgi:heavy metal-binding protein